MPGASDCKTVYSISAGIIGKEIEKLLDHVEAGNTRAKILLVSPIHLGDGVWNDDFVKEFRSESVTVSKQLENVYRKIAFNRRISNLDASDILSPDDAEREHLDKV